MATAPVITPPPRAPNIRGLVADPEFERLTPELQRATLAKVTGDQTFLRLTDGETQAFSQKLGGSGDTAAPQGGVVSSLQDQPGQSPFRRFLQGSARTLIGLPVSALGELAAFRRDPTGTIDNMLVTGPRRAVAQLNADEPQKPWNSVGNIVGNVAALPGEAAAAVPLLGPFAEHITHELTHGDIAGGAGEIAGALVAPKLTELAAKAPGAAADAVTRMRDSGAGSAVLGPRPEGVDPVQGTVRALRARNTVRDFPQKVATALPDIRQGLDELGIDPKQMNVRDIEPAIAKAKTNVWKEWIQRFYGRNAHVMLGTQPIADAIAGAADKMSAVTRAENPALMQKIAGTAAFYDGQRMPISEIESRIQDLNNELRAAQSTFKVNRNALMNDPQYSYRFAELSALRKMEADAFDRMSGPGASVLKQRYGALNVLQDVADRRIGVIERQASDKLFGGLGKIAGAANLAAGAVSAATGRMSTAAEQIARGGAEWRLGRNLQTMNDPEFLLRAALSKTKPRGAFVPAAANTPTAATLAGYLPERVMPPAAPATPEPPTGNANPIPSKAFVGGGVVRGANGKMERVPTTEVPLYRNPVASFDAVRKPNGDFEYEVIRDKQTGRMKKVIKMQRVNPR